MPKQLTVHNATITTAAVQVKTLTISGKQVTLAVFRQLLEEPILHQLDANITGTPWGRVNYHPDKCADEPDHMHVVWQKGEELRRAKVQSPEAGYHPHPAADVYVQARILHGTAQQPWTAAQKGDPLQLCERDYDGSWRTFGHGRLRHGQMSFRGDIPVNLRRAWRAERKLTAEDVEVLEEYAYCLGISTESNEATLREALAMLPAAQYRESWDELSALPQLFIAV